MSRASDSRDASDSGVPPDGVSQEGGSGRIRAVQHPIDAWLFHPLAARLAKALSATPVSPNMVSLAGGLAIVLAGYVYLQDLWPYTALLGLLVHATWHIFDGADGDLARLTGRSSPSGEIFDGMCDYFGHTALYLMLAFALSDTLGWGGLGLAATAGASRIAQANFYETQRRQYMFWVHNVAWLRSSPADPGSLARFGPTRGYLWLAGIIAPTERAIDDAVQSPEKAQRVKDRLEKLGAKSLYGSSWLGAPPRTLALGAAMLAGLPLWYFLFEIVFLNAILAVSIWRARQTLAELKQLA